VLVLTEKVALYFFRADAAGDFVTAPVSLKVD
jgi:hypothetical protein